MDEELGRKTKGAAIMISVRVDEDKGRIGRN